VKNRFTMKSSTLNALAAIALGQVSIWALDHKLRTFLSVCVVTTWILLDILRNHNRKVN